MPRLHALNSPLLTLISLLLTGIVNTTTGAAEANTHRTRVALADGQWHINGKITYPGAAAEGLLMNVRMVNAVFEDRNKPEFNPEANTAQFIAKLPEYAAHGVRAITLCLQGGMPGYEGAVNSAFEPDGTLRTGYRARVEHVIRACDRHGVAVILGLFYQRQSAILHDETALRTGVINTALWVRRCGFENVLLEIANEYPHRGFVHALIRDPKGQAALIRLARETTPGLLVSASGLRASIEHGASSGAMFKKPNQTFPFHFEGASDDPLFYAELRRLATPTR